MIRAINAHLSMRLLLFVLVAVYFLGMPTGQASAKPLDFYFELGDASQDYNAWGAGNLQRAYPSEYLSACFERTLILEVFDPARTLKWVFTGDRAGVTVTINSKAIRLHRRYYDSFAFNRLAHQNPRHPEVLLEAKETELDTLPRAVTVRMDHRYRFTVLVDGHEVFFEWFMQDLQRHQLQLDGKGGVVRGRIQAPSPVLSNVHVDPSKTYQTMIGFGGIATPTAYAQLSLEGKRQWWQLVCEYNLLIQREYPNGNRLNRAMDNWDRLADATPHYYADNFPNGEISDFDYCRIIRRLGGEVWFEFWGLPPWVGKDVEKYADAMVNYCRTSQEKAGAPPEIVGIQNEIGQKPEQWHAMTLTLRQALDRAGFQQVRIHMSDASKLNSGIARIKAFQQSPKAWDTIDYSATHMYDYQGHFDDPDRYDDTLREWARLSAGKPFLSTELCINNGKYQLNSYRAALTMAQLYHKNLTIADAAAICYCWTLLNVEQPSYGATRSLCVPDRRHGFVPVASSQQLRVFGSFSRRIRKGMQRVDVQTGNKDLLASAYADEGRSKTLVMLNRGVVQRRLRVHWPGARFTELERTDPYHPNTIQVAPKIDAKGQYELLIDGGTLVTLTSVPLGVAPEKVLGSVD